MKLSNSFMSSLKKNIKALCMVNIASYLVFGTDNILISTFTGLSNVFIYTNYNTIIGLVNKLFHNVFDSMRASVGNYMITESKEKTYGLFQRIFFLNFAVTCYTTVSMLTCFNDAITIWLGKKYIWPIITVAILVTNNYMRYIQQASAVFRNAAGIYTPYSLYKFMPIIEGSINLLFSIMFVVIFPENKATGIFIGTSVSTIFFTIYGIHALYRYYFVDYRMRTYFIKYLWYFLTTIVLAILSLNMSKAIVNWLNIKSMIIVLIIDLFVALIVSLSGIIIIFRKNEELAFYIKLFLKVLRGVEIYE